MGVLKCKIRSWSLPQLFIAILLIFFLWRCNPTRVMASSFFTFLDHTQRRTTVGRTPLDEWSARRRDLYLTTHDTHNRQTSMPPVGFEPTISAGERLQAHALETRDHWDRRNIINAYYNYNLSLIHSKIIYILTLRWLMSYIYGAPILDVSRSHTTTQHSR